MRAASPPPPTSVATEGEEELDFSLINDLVHLQHEDDVGNAWSFLEEKERQARNSVEVKHFAERAVEDALKTMGLNHPLEDEPHLRMFDSDNSQPALIEVRSSTSSSSSSSSSQSPEKPKALHGMNRKMRTSSPNAFMQPVQAEEKAASNSNNNGFASSETVNLLEAKADIRRSSRSAEGHGSALEPSELKAGDEVARAAALPIEPRTPKDDYFLGDPNESQHAAPPVSSPPSVSPPNGAQQPSYGLNLQQSDFWNQQHDSKKSDESSSASPSDFDSPEGNKAKQPPHRSLYDFLSEHLPADQIDNPKGANGADSFRFRAGAAAGATEGETGFAYKPSPFKHPPPPPVPPPPPPPPPPNFGPGSEFSGYRFAGSDPSSSSTPPSQGSAPVFASYHETAYPDSSPFSHQNEEARELSKKAAEEAAAHMDAGHDAYASFLQTDERLKPFDASHPNFPNEFPAMPHIFPHSFFNRQAEDRYYDPWAHFKEHPYYAQFYDHAPSYDAFIETGELKEAKRTEERAAGNSRSGDSVSEEERDHPLRIPQTLEEYDAIVARYMQDARISA